MKIAITFLFFSTLIFAESFHYEMKGMHCGACKKAVSSTVCKLPGIKTCEVKVGTMTLVSEEGKTIDQDAVKKAVQEAADKYKGEYAIASVKPVSDKETETKKPTDTPKDK